MNTTLQYPCVLLDTLPPDLPSFEKHAWVIKFRIQLSDSHELLHLPVFHFLMYSHKADIPYTLYANTTRNRTNKHTSEIPHVRLGTSVV